MNAYRKSAPPPVVPLEVAGDPSRPCGMCGRASLYLVCARCELRSMGVTITLVDRLASFLFGRGTSSGGPR